MRELWYHGSSGCQLLARRRPATPALTGSPRPVLARDVARHAYRPTQGNRQLMAAPMTALRARRRPQTASSQPPEAGHDPAVPHLDRGRARRPDAARCSTSSSMARALHRLSRAIRWLPRCSPTTCGSSGARSNITGHAAFSRPARKSPTRMVELRHRRAPRAQHPRHHGRSSTKGWRPPARTAGHRCASMRLARQPGGCHRSSAAGFYYKTFMWPASFWEKVYEPMIRRAAGLGRAADACPIPTSYDRMRRPTATCWWSGGGPAGLAAALAAGARAAPASSSADENATPGVAGCWRNGATIDGAAGRSTWVADCGAPNFGAAARRAASWRSHHACSAATIDGRIRGNRAGERIIWPCQPPASRRASAIWKHPGQTP